MFRRIQPYLESLTALCEEDLEVEPARGTSSGGGSSNEDNGRTAYLHRVPWEQERAREERKRRREREEGSGSSSSRNANSVRSNSRKRQLQQVVKDVAPLLDRCGRLLADLAPHVSALAEDERGEEGAPRTSR